MLLLSCSELIAGTNDLAWPTITREMRPWAYWWWMGSAVDKTNLSRELQRYHDAGLGGVHIIPIYGANGYEDKYIPYLSPAWMEMLRHSVTEATRLDLGVDMTTGSGWCFGGPGVTADEANALVQVKTFDVAPGETLRQKFDPKTIQALVAYSTDGKSIDLAKRIAASGSVDWSADTNGYKIYAVTQRPSGQKVKRSAPGGEGHMLNLIYPPAVGHFLERFNDAFAHYDGPKPRAMYHDSYEYRSDWAPNFFAQFEKRRGYRLQDQLPAMFGPSAGERTARVKCDYRETVSDIMAEESIPLWVNWSHQHGFITRNEAHGSPANLLDLYAAADVPETEMFNKDRNKLISKFASSAAHVAGHRLVGAETGTWLKEHFTETLADVKYLADDMFLSGVNHIFYHGACYSPDEAGWPGWLFYASTEMNPRNSIWHDVPAVNAYIARCQSILQQGAPDNDLLLYWPIHDFWQKAGGMLPHLTVHARAWFEQQAIGKAAERLWSRGFTFDYVSDRQLAQTKFDHGELATPGAHYRAVVVPRCDFMPLPTLKQLMTLAEAGAMIVFEDRLPTDVPGFAALDARRAEFHQLIATIKDAADGKVQASTVGKGRIVVGPLESALAATDVHREPMVDHPGLWFIRRSIESGRNYFIANRGDTPLDGWVSLSGKFRSTALLDPLTGRSGLARTRGERGAEVYLQLQPGASVIVKTFADTIAEGKRCDYLQPTDRPVALTGEWKLEFVSGGPVLPSRIALTNLKSWADSPDGEAQRFAGTGRYTFRFDAPAGFTTNLLLDLGRVAESARVRLNGRDLGTLIIPPFRVRIDNLAARDNVLEVEVTNVSANRLRDLDRRGVKWRNFHDINFVNMDYKQFDAANWPTYESGLIGPVTLQRTN